MWKLTSYPVLLHLHVLYTAFLHTTTATSFFLVQFPQLHLPFLFLWLFYTLLLLATFLPSYFFCNFSFCSSFSKTNDRCSVFVRLCDGGIDLLRTVDLRSLCGTCSSQLVHCHWISEWIQILIRMEKTIKKFYMCLSAAQYIFHLIDVSVDFELTGASRQSETLLTASWRRMLEFPAVVPQKVDWEVRLELSWWSPYLLHLFCWSLL